MRGRSIASTSKNIDYCYTYRLEEPAAAPDENRRKNILKRTREIYTVKIVFFFYRKQIFIRFYTCRFQRFTFSLLFTGV